MVKWYKEKEINNFPRHKGHTKYMLCIPSDATSSDDFLIQRYTGEYWEIEGFDVKDIILFSELPEFPQGLVDDATKDVIPAPLYKFNIKGDVVIVSMDDKAILSNKSIDCNVEAEDKYSAIDKIIVDKRNEYLSDRDKKGLGHNFVHVYLSRDTLVDGDKLFYRRNK